MFAPWLTVPAAPRHRQSAACTWADLACGSASAEAAQVDARAMVQVSCLSPVASASSLTSFEASI